MARPLFRNEDGTQIAFFLDTSIKQQGARDRLEQDITAHGGVISTSRRRAKYMLVDPTHLHNQTVQSLQRAFGTNPHTAGVIVKPHGFVRAYIKRGAPPEYNPVIQGMGGPSGRHARTEFTHEDDVNLARYIAQCIPDIQSGGRLGNAIYNDLVNNPDIPWRDRHTASSWRERYKKNQERFNIMIAHYAAENPPQPAAVYFRDRRRGGRNGLMRQYEEAQDDEDGEDFRQELARNASEDYSDLREEEEESADENRAAERVPDENRQPQMVEGVSFRPQRDSTRPPDSLGKRARRPSNASIDAEIDSPLRKSGKRTQRPSGRNPDPASKRLKVASTANEGVEAAPEEHQSPEKDITLDAVDDVLASDFGDNPQLDWLDEPGPSGTQRTLVGSQPPSDELRSPSKSTSSNANDPYIPPHQPAAIPEPVVNPTQSSRKGKEKMTHTPSPQPSIHQSVEEVHISRSEEEHEEESHSSPLFSDDEPSQSLDDSTSEMQTIADVLLATSANLTTRTSDTSQEEFQPDSSFSMSPPPQDLEEDHTHSGDSLATDDGEIEQRLQTHRPRELSEAPPSDSDEVEHPFPTPSRSPSRASSLATDDAQTSVALRLPLERPPLSRPENPPPPNVAAPREQNPFEGRTARFSTSITQKVEPRVPPRRSAPSTSTPRPSNPNLSHQPSSSKLPITPYDQGNPLSSRLNSRKGATRSAWRPTSTTQSEARATSLQGKLRSSASSHVPQTASDSDSGSDVFIPSPHTKAHDFKQQVDQAAKTRPYKPPLGTRAAQLHDLQRR